MMILSLLHFPSEMRAVQISAHASKYDALVCGEHRGRDGETDSQVPKCRKTSGCVFATRDNR